MSVAAVLPDTFVEPGPGFGSVEDDGARLARALVTSHVAHVVRYIMRRLQAELVGGGVSAGQEGNGHQFARRMNATDQLRGVTTRVFSAHHFRIDTYLGCSRFAVVVGGKVLK